jgi:hypothetical protein
MKSLGKRSLPSISSSVSGSMKTFANGVAVNQRESRARIAHRKAPARAPPGYHRATPTITPTISAE